MGHMPVGEHVGGLPTIFEANPPADDGAPTTASNPPMGGWVVGGGESAFPNANDDTATPRVIANTVQQGPYFPPGLGRDNSRYVRTTWKPRV